MAIYFYLLVALFLILIFGLKMFTIIIVCGIIGGIGDSIWKAKLEAHKEKKLQEKMDKERNEVLHSLCDQCNSRKHSNKVNN